MKKISIFCTAVLLGLLALPQAQAIEFDEVRSFEDVFVISASAPARDRVEIHWEIADGYYLYNNKFLRFTSATDGVVAGQPEVPQGEISFDDLLGEDVEKYQWVNRYPAARFSGFRNQGRATEGPVPGLPGKRAVLSADRATAGSESAR